MKEEVLAILYKLREETEGYDADSILGTINHIESEVESCYANGHTKEIKIIYYKNQ